MFEYFQKGGPVMYFILLLSVYGVSIVIERFYFFYKALCNSIRPLIITLLLLLLIIR